MTSKGNKDIKVRSLALSGRWLPALAALALLLPRSGMAIDLLVYNTNDSGPGSLRQVISDNNATAGGNTIIFSNVVTGTITLTNGLLTISKNLDLVGPGANVLAVSGNNASRVFLVTNATTVSISGLTIRNGSVTGSSYPTNAGGGILNDHSTLTVSNCLISSNSAASDGGGILNYGESSGSATLRVTATTFSGNSAAFIGGGIYNIGTGGSAMLTISNCTFSGNSATVNGGGIYNSAGALTVIASTFSGNATSTNATGCIYNYFNGTVEIGNTILNAGTAATNLASFGTSFTSRGYNISSDGGTGYLNGVGDQINTDPRLGPLQDNGGPTPTHAPLPGSPAIDQGKSFGLITDQRGRPKPFDNPAIPNASLGDGSDIGAVEAQSGEIFPTFVMNTNDNGPGSLRQALLAAVSGLAIEFQSNVLGTITLTSGELFISNSITIQGPGANVLGINGNASNRVFRVTNATVTLSGLTITNGYANAVSGGGILNEHSTLTVSNCVVMGNSTTVNGGGIYNNGISNGISTLVVVGSTVSGNSASLNGGGIYNAGVFSGTANLTVTASTLSSNTATLAGGIYNNGRNSGHATVTMLASTMAGNSASTSGGGIYLDAVSSGFAKLEIGDTILKAGVAGTNIFSAGGTVLSDGYNLSNDGGSGLLTNATDQINTDPQLGPLQNNGGPTPTMALLSNSPAIDKGKSFGLTTDQRGAPRPFDFSSAANASGGDGSDIGAFESGQPLLNITSISPNVVLSWPDYYGGFTLESATNLPASNNWSTVPGTPMVVSNQFKITNGPAAGNLFFRLRGF